MEDSKWAADLRRRMDVAEREENYAVLTCLYKLYDVQILGNKENEDSIWKRC